MNRPVPASIHTKFFNLWKTRLAGIDEKTQRLARIRGRRSTRTTFPQGSRSIRIVDIAIFLYRDIDGVRTHFPRGFSHFVRPWCWMTHGFVTAIGPFSVSRSADHACRTTDRAIGTLGYSRFGWMKSANSDLDPD